MSLQYKNFINCLIIFFNDLKFYIMPRKLLPLASLLLIMTFATNKLASQNCIQCQTNPNFIDISNMLCSTPWAPEIEIIYCCSNRGFLLTHIEINNYSGDPLYIKRNDDPCLIIQPGNCYTRKAINLREIHYFQFSNTNCTDFLCSFTFETICT